MVFVPGALLSRSTNPILEDRCTISLHDGVATPSSRTKTNSIGMVHHENRNRNDRKGKSSGAAGNNNKVKDQAKCHWRIGKLLE